MPTLLMIVYLLTAAIDNPLITSKLKAALPTST